jgi:hypothetical protein
MRIQILLCLIYQYFSAYDSYLSSSKVLLNKSRNVASIYLKTDKYTDKINQIFSFNPLVRIIYNTYDFFYWLPRRNILYDVPPAFWRNSTSQYIQWYQFPHNLPPYDYLGSAWPEDFFCYGLPGAILPLGKWDPFGLHLVSEKVVKKYRESELKHGRLAMLATIAIPLQEVYHPLHPEVGGLAVTQIDHVFELPFEKNVMLSWIPGINSFSSQISLPIDYFFVIGLLMLCEVSALYRNWNRWFPNEFNHQYDHNIGIGNLKQVFFSYYCYLQYLFNMTSINLRIMKMEIMDLILSD